MLKEKGRNTILELIEIQYELAYVYLTVTTA